ncbi:MAG: hypothetical protein R3220_11955 [Balneolaceae bacterium]|nr:hypothetical protein [Balneolaceae bacterium]
MNRLKWIVEKVSRRYSKYRYKFNTARNLKRLQFHRSNFPNPSKVHITCTGATDGGCAQIGRILSAISFVNAFGFTYIHTPLSYVSHNVNDDPNWAQKWENYFQLSSFGKESPVSPDRFRIVRNMNELIPDIIRSKKNPDNQYYQIRHCHPYTNRVPESYFDILDKVRDLYANNGRTPNLIYNENTFNIAIHVRRGDVSKENEPIRFTSAKKLKSTIQKISKVLKDMDHKIYLFCVNLDDDLKKLESKDIHVIHELDIFDVLDHLIHADLLVTSKSSVGYISGFLNDGIIIYEPFWHPPLPGWLNMDTDFKPGLKTRIGKLQIRN